MAQQERPLSPFLLYRKQYTMTLSILHRLTGVFMTFGLPLLVCWLTALAGGAEAYAKVQKFFATPIMKAVFFLWMLSFMYHLLNGIRHLFWDMGYGFERAAARRSGWIVFVGAVVLTAIAWTFVLTRFAGEINVGGGPL